MKRAASAPSLPVVLLTGFEPFGGEATNPSWEAVRVLQDARIGGHRIETRCLPVAFGAAGDALRAAIRATRPALVVCVGQAGGRERISIERVAINVDDARSAPAEVSQTAGTYVCNHVFYALMHALRRRPGVRGGFVHIPYSPEQARRHPGAPALPVADVTAALRRMVAVAIRHADDVAIPGGATH